MTDNLEISNSFLALGFLFTVPLYLVRHYYLPSSSILGKLSLNLMHMYMICICIPLFHLRSRYGLYYLFLRYKTNELSTTKSKCALS